MISNERLREVILEYRSEVVKHSIVPRNICLEEFDRQVLVGVRRAGKSYIMYGRIQQLISAGHAAEEIVYLNFEDERLDGMTLEDLNKILEVQGQLSDSRPMLFLDEIQNVEGWEKFARRIADSKYKVVITGSNAKMLSVDVSGALGGRYLTREVFPFSFSEYLSLQGIDSHDVLLTATTASRGVLMRHFEEYFRFGGFAECATMSVKRDYLMSLYQKIFLGDICVRNNIDNILALKVLLRKIAEGIKQPVSFTRAANIVASTGIRISKNSVINYLGYAIDAYLLLTVPNIADKLAGRVSSPKYYFIDNGIISLLAMDIRTSLLENLVALSLFRRYGSRDAVYYYNHGIEVDFVVPEQEMAIQVCYTMYDSDSTFERETMALVKLQAKIPTKRNVIVTYEDEGTVIRGGIEILVVPAWKFSLEIEKRE